MLLKIPPAKEHLRLPAESWFTQHKHTFPSFPLHTAHYFSSLLCSLLRRGISAPGLSKTLCDTSLKKRLARLPCFHTPFWADAINCFWTQDAEPQKPFTSCPDLRLNFSSSQRRVAVRFPRCRWVSIWVAFLYTSLGRCSASATRVTSTDTRDTAARATSCPWDPLWGQDQPWDPAGAATLLATSQPCLRQPRGPRSAPSLILSRLLLKNDQKYPLHYYLLPSFLLPY